MVGAVHVVLSSHSAPNTIRCTTSLANRSVLARGMVASGARHTLQDAPWENSHTHPSLISPSIIARAESAGKRPSSAVGFRRADFRLAGWVPATGRARPGPRPKILGAKSAPDYTLNLLFSSKSLHPQETTRMMTMPSQLLCVIGPSMYGRSSRRGLPITSRRLSSVDQNIWPRRTGW